MWSASFHFERSRTSSPGKRHFKVVSLKNKSWAITESRKAQASRGTLAGCSTPSVITLNDGSQIQTVDTPAFDEDSGFYEFEQLDGKPAKINKDQVITVKEL